MYLVTASAFGKKHLAAACKLRAELLRYKLTAGKLHDSIPLFIASGEHFPERNQ